MPSGATRQIGESDHATLVVADPPRQSWFALWRDTDAGTLLDLVDADDHLERRSIELTRPDAHGKLGTAGTSVRVLPIASAIDELAGLEASDTVTPSVRAWSVGVRLALDLVARGRLLPSLTDEGFDAWRLDPLDADDRQRFSELAAALPPQAMCRPIQSARTGAPNFHEPTRLVRGLYDAVADSMVRTSAAAAIVESPPFADVDRLRLQHLRSWIDDIASVHCAGAVLALRVFPPDTLFPETLDSGVDSRHHPDSVDLDLDLDFGADGGGAGAAMWRVVFQLRSQLDPSLVIDADQLWSSPREVMERLGREAEVDLLAGLRRAADICPALAPALDRSAPSHLDITDDALDELLDRLDDLSAASIEVRWPSDLVSPTIERTLVVGASAPGGALPTITDLDSLLTVNWEFLLDGSPLTTDELAILGEAKRPMVPIRGRWVRLDHRTRERLRERAPVISAADALAAALGDGLDLSNLLGSKGTLDGALDQPEVVAVEVRGAVEDLAKRLQTLTGEREEPEPAQLQAELRPYQRRGLAWMSDLCDIGLGGCLADDMGLGKTIQLLSLHAKRGGATLVVCPTSLVANWEREAKRFLPSTIVHRYHGPSRSLGTVEPGDLVITTYGVVRTDVDALSAESWDLVVADEAQHAKNPRSRTAKALRQLPGRARIALTGTPVENRLTELWSILDWAVPGLLGPLETFRRNTATPIEKDGDPEATARLATIVAPFLLRRKKTDPGIAPELPPKNERDVVVPLTDEQVSLYKATTEEVLADLRDNDGLARHGIVLRLLTALKQITNHPAQFLGETGPIEGRSGKIDAFDELIDLALGNGEQTLVFSQYVSMGELLVDHLTTRGVSSAILHGGLTVAKRQELVDRFQAGALDVLVLSLKAGGTGLNLTAATHVIHYDRWWNPAVEDQATDRAYRIGQKNTVSVHRLVTEGTVEDRVAELLRTKRALADKVIGGGESWIGNLDDDDLAALVRLDQPTLDGAGADGSEADSPDSDSPDSDDGEAA